MLTIDGRASFTALTIGPFRSSEAWDGALAELASHPARRSTPNVRHHPEDKTQDSRMRGSSVLGRERQAWRRPWPAGLGVRTAREGGIQRGNRPSPIGPLMS